MDPFLIVIANYTKNIDQFKVPVFLCFCLNIFRSQLLSVDILRVGLMFISLFLLDPFGNRRSYA